MTRRRLLQGMAGALLVAILLPVLYIAVFGWNWLRAPMERITAEKTGRILAIKGDLGVEFGWPLPHIHADRVSFANPSWAREKLMLEVASVDVSIDLPQLFRERLVLPEVRLEHPVIFLEQNADGKRNWLLDVNQQDEGTRIRIGRLMLDHGQLGYDDVARQTHIQAELSTSSALEANAELTFSADGQYRGLPLKASGNGGPVLGLRDEITPYPLNMTLTVEHTRVKANGSITSLLGLTAMDMRLVVSGDSLQKLFPLIGISLPATHPYMTDGHIIHSGHVWRYEDFSGRIGDSDIAGTFQIATGGKRPVMKADLVSRLLDIADLGPLIGARPGSLQTAKQATPAPSRTDAPLPAQARVLPELPFKTERWNSVDAEVTLKADTIRRARELPLENLFVHLSLRDSVLTLDPLNVGMAGGELKAAITLDGSSEPIQAHAQVRARKLFIAKLFPTVDLNRNSIGQINGEFDLAGKGNSVRDMLGSSHGKLGLVVSGGEISKLMLEKIGLHLWEILELKMTGDKLVKLRCVVADFDVKQGNMRADALVFDTEITTIVGTGSIDLAQEKLDLTLNQKTKNTSPLALRSPIHIGGSLASPNVSVDKGRMFTRGLGAIALGMVNPLLVLVPLIDAGPGKDSDCGKLVADARGVQGSTLKEKRPPDTSAHRGPQTAN